MSNAQIDHQKTVISNKSFSFFSIYKTLMNPKVQNDKNKLLCMMLLCKFDKSPEGHLCISVYDPVHVHALQCYPVIAVEKHDA